MRELDNSQVLLVTLLSREEKGVKRRWKIITEESFSDSVVLHDL